MDAASGEPRQGRGVRSQDEAQGELVSLYKRSRTEGFGAEVQRRILIGTFALSHGYYDAYYNRALQARTLIAQDFEQAFSRVDFIITPTAPTPAFRLGEKTQDPIAMYYSDIFTTPTSLAGLPAVSLCCGWSADGLPIGLQIIGPNGADEKLLELAMYWEKATNGEFIREVR